MNFKKQIFAMAKQDVKTIVFPEASFSDIIIKAIRVVVKKKLAKVILIGDESALYLRYSSLENDFLKIINPKTSELKPEFLNQISKREDFAEFSDEHKQVFVENPYYFSALLVKNGYADGIVSGTETAGAIFFKKMLAILKPSNVLPSTCTLFIGKNKTLKNRPILISDSALIENPTEIELVQSAFNAVELWKTLFITEPKVAFLSFSTNGSYENESSIKMREATKMFKYKYPNIVADGEMQLDTAICELAQRKKFDNSRIKGDANILIVPDINSGNILEKTLHTIAGLQQIGPFSQNFLKPVSMACRISSVDEIVLLTALTAVQAQE